MCRSKNHAAKVFLIVTFLFIVLLVTGNLSAETFPSRPITIVNGWGAGGMSDTLTRLLSTGAEKELGQPIINENKTGGAGQIAINYVCKSKPDGYTLGITVTALYIIAPQTRHTTYDPFTDITDIMTFAQYNNGICVRADSPWNTIEDVIAYAKSNPSKFTYAVSGIGMTPHIVMEEFSRKEGIKLTPVPFKSGPEGVNATLGGHVDAVIMGTGDLIPQIQAGKLRLLLIISGERWPETPDVPTILEKGHDFYMLSYMGIFGPKGIPEPIREKLERAFKNGMKEPAFQEMLRKYSIKEAYLSGKEYSKKWKEMYGPMGEVLKTLGLVEKK